MHVRHKSLHISFFFLIVFNRERFIEFHYFLFIIIIIIIIIIIG